MGDGSIIANPLGAAQARLLCSPRRHLQIAIGYPIGVGLLTLMVYRASQPMTPDVLATGFMAIIGGIQLLLLAPVAAGAIRRSIQRDYVSGMVESHRLSGMSASTVILGYLTGATAQALTLAADNYVMGMIAAGFIPNRPFLEWTVANLFILCVAFVVWSTTTFMAVATQGRNNLVGVLMAFALMGGIAAYHVLPALLFVIGPILLLLRLRGVAAGVTPPPEMLLSIPLQLGIGLTFCAAAARKYRRADEQGFNAALGLILLMLAAVSCVGGLALVRGFQAYIPGGPLDAPAEAMTLATSVFLTVIATVPIAAAAQASGRWERRRIVDAEFKDRAPRGYFLVALATVGIVIFSLMVCDVVQRRHVLEPVPVAIASGLCLCVGLLGLAGFLRRAYAVRDGVWFWGAAYFLIVWVVPIVGEVVIYVYRDVEGAMRSFTPLIAFSPVGAAFAISRGLDVWLWPGIVTQCVLAIVLCARRNRGQRPAALGLESRAALG